MIISRNQSPLSSVPAKSPAVTDTPLPLSGWKPEHGSNRLTVIEQDIRSLMRALAEANAARDEQKQQQSEQLKQFLLSLLDVIDAFDRVFGNIHTKKDACTPQMKIWTDNFRAVYRKLDGILSKQAVTRIECLNQEFDPHWHEIEKTLCDFSKPEGTIIEEIKKGYIWRDNQLLRHAVVAVISHSPPENDAAEMNQD